MIYSAVTCSSHFCGKTIIITASVASAPILTTDPQKGQGYETTNEYWADDISHCLINVSPSSCHRLILRGLLAYCDEVVRWFIF